MAEAYILTQDQTIDGVGNGGGGNTTPTLAAKYNGAEAYVFVSGNLGGGSIQIEFLSPNFNVEAGHGSDVWIPVDGGLIDTALIKSTIRIPDNVVVRSNLSGSTGANVSVEISK